VVLLKFNDKVHGEYIEGARRMSVAVEYMPPDAERRTFLWDLYSCLRTPPRGVIFHLFFWARGVGTHMSTAYVVRGTMTVRKSFLIVVRDVPFVTLAIWVIIAAH
jgi:hypothetical protein